MSDPVDTAAIRLRHYAFRGNCMGCTRSHGGYHDYPCETIRLADALDTARAASSLHSVAEGEAHLGRAWDEGYAAGYSRSFHDPKPKVNPYRAEGEAP
jgi:hypothetical protein